MIQKSTIGVIGVGHVGGYADLAAAQIVIIAAGVGRRPGENRLDLLNRNADVLGQIAAQLDRHATNAVLLGLHQLPAGRSPNRRSQFRTWGPTHRLRVDY